MSSPRLLQGIMLYQCDAILSETAFWEFFTSVADTDPDPVVGITIF
jgi:hypothetical protein